MSEKSNKKLRRTIRKNSDQFKIDGAGEFIIRLTVLKAWPRFKMCFSLFLKLNRFQIELKKQINERRKQEAEQAKEKK